MHLGDKAKATASGTKAKATVKPANISILARPGAIFSGPKPRLSAVMKFCVAFVINQPQAIGSFGNVAGECARRNRSTLENATARIAATYRVVSISQYFCAVRN